MYSDFIFTEEFKAAAEAAFPKDHVLTLYIEKGMAGAVELHIKDRLDELKLNEIDNLVEERRFDTLIATRKRQIARARLMELFYALKQGAYEETDKEANAAICREVKGSTGNGAKNTGRVGANTRLGKSTPYNHAA